MRADTYRMKWSPVRAVRGRVVISALAVAPFAISCSEQAEFREEAVESVATVDRLACQTDRKVVQTALDAYFALEGEAAEASEAVLVSEGFLQEESAFVDIDNGTVIFVGGCAD